MNMTSPKIQAGARTLAHALPGIVLWLAAGMTIGIVLGVRLHKYQLDGCAATLIGSFLGSAITVAGALLMSQAADRRSKAALRLVAIESVNIVEEPLSNFRAAFNSAEDAWHAADNGAAMEDSHDKLIISLRGLGACAGVTRTQFDELRPVFHASGAVAARAQYHISHALQDIKDGSNLLLQELEEDGFFFAIPRGHDLLLQQIEASKAAIAEHLAEL